MSVVSVYGWSFVNLMPFIAMTEENLMAIGRESFFADHIALAAAVCEVDAEYRSW